MKRLALAPELASMAGAGTWIAPTQDDQMSAYRIRIAGYRLKRGKLVPNVRRFYVSQRLRQQGASGSERFDPSAVACWAQVREMPTVSGKPSVNGLARCSAEDTRLVPIVEVSGRYYPASA